MEHVLVNRVAHQDDRIGLDLFRLRGDLVRDRRDIGV